MVIKLSENVNENIFHLLNRINFAANACMSVPSDEGPQFSQACGTCPSPPKLMPKEGVSKDSPSLLSLCQLHALCLPSEQNTNGPAQDCQEPGADSPFGKQ